MNGEDMAGNNVEGVKHAVLTSDSDEIEIHVKYDPKIRPSPLRSAPAFDGKVVGETVSGPSL